MKNKIFKYFRKYRKINIYSKKCLIILIFINYIFFHNFWLFSNNMKKLCDHCIKDITNLNSQCFKCSNEYLFQNLYIASKDETLDEIIKFNKSISRFGDGEYYLLFGRYIHFQRKSKNLVGRLLEILNSNDKKCLIGIYYPYKKKELDLYTDREINYWRRFSYKNKFKLYKLINQKKKYYSAGITKFYKQLKDKSKIPKYVQKLKKVWEGRDIIVVEGKNSKIGIGSDLFNNTKSIKRIICPSHHSFMLYHKILDAVIKFDKNNLILVSLGPTATILTYDLCKLGYQSVDIGHTDNSYEDFIRHGKPSPIQNEIKKISEKQKVKYNQQIVNRIG